MNEANRKAILDELLEEILSTMLEDAWSISLEDLLQHLEIPREDYYRWAYAAMRKNEASIQDEYNQDNVFELVLFLTDMGWKNARSRFRDEGLFFSGEDRVDWITFFVSFTLSRVQNHTPDLESLDLILSACTNPLDGFDTYRESAFPMDELIERALGPFLESKRIRDHHLSRSILETETYSNFINRTIQLDDLFATLNEKLAKAARENGFVDAGFYTGKSDQPLSSEIKEALRTMELPDHTFPDSDALKNQYRNLMKRYHPDVNSDPGAEARTREMVHAYSLLSGSIPG